MLKYIVIAFHLLLLHVLVSALPNTKEPLKTVKTEEFFECANKTGAGSDIRELVRVRAENATKEQKCFTSCILNVFGVLSTSGEFTGSFENVFYTVEEDSDEVRKKAEEIDKECMTTAKELTDTCERGYRLKICMLSKIEKAPGLRTA